MFDCFVVRVVYCSIVYLFAVESTDCGCVHWLSAAGYIQEHTDPHVALTVVYLQYIRNKLEFDQQKYVHTYLSNLWHVLCMQN